MYIPKSFAVDDPELLRAIMASHGFATLISSGPAGLVATHVPVLFEATAAGKGRMIAHLARANPHGETLDGADVLAIFQGPHGYISPSWYAAHPAVPTWNYVAVHVYGRARLVREPERLREIVSQLVDIYEGGRPAPWRMAGLSDDYLRGMLNAIVGVEIDVERLEGKHKLSQNRDAEDRRRVIAALADSADPQDRQLAAYMTEHAPAR
ncbi:MAG TPA: FMN-binding negative transcriptional regulator [Alphaproteobacteria bacterium]